MTRYPVIMTVMGGLIGALSGALVGAGAIFLLRSLCDSPFFVFDGAWLGAAFSIPMGGIVGLFVAVDRKDKNRLAP